LSPLDDRGSTLDSAKFKTNNPSANSIFTPYVRKVIISYGLMAYVTMAINALMVLWLYTPVKAGGIGFSSAEIGVTLALSGLLGTGVTAIVFPPLERRMGVLPLYRFSMVMQLLNGLMFPLGHAFAIAGGKNGAYLGVGTTLVVRSIGSIVYVCNMLLVTRSVPSGHSLATVNALAQMVGSGSRAVAPAVTTSLFAFSIKSGILGGNLIWIVLSLVTLLGIAVAYRIPSNRPSDTESQRGN
ncbi:unnamed protein product, partial [Rhizoctonia solani]